jgi:hypothetical protein
MIKRFVLSTFIATITAAIALPASVSADPHCSACPYSCFDLGLSSKECSQLSTSNGICCLDLTKKGLAVAREYERVKESTRPTAVQERCPSGFYPSEQKCSVEERRRGCKDMRLPGGLGCVRR